jgi:phosphatidate cytidylyltransferase
VSEFVKRLIFSLAAAPLVILALWGGGPWLVALLSVTAALASYEFYRLAIGSGNTPLWGHGVLLSAAVPVFVYGRFLGYWTPTISVLMIVVLELLTVALWFRGSAGRPLEVVGITILGVLYTGGMLSFAFALRYHGYAIGAAAGTALVALPLLLTWGTDIGAYVFGRWLGVRKLMPAVSPAKTVAGAFGGLAVSVAVCLLFVAFVLRPYGRLSMTPAGALVFALVVSAAGQVGDLVESMLKREAGVKDSSNLIPGHGGMLDRVDSLLFTLPVGYVLLGWLLTAAP